MSEAPTAEPDPNPPNASPPGTSRLDISTPDPTTPDPRPSATRADAADAPTTEARSPWHWLLLVPVIVPLLTFLYNAKNPYFLGFPRFYWLQLAFILLGVGTTTLVYQATKERRPAKHRSDR